MKYKLKELILNCNDPVYTLYIYCVFEMFEFYFFLFIHFRRKGKQINLDNLRMIHRHMFIGYSTKYF